MARQKRGILLALLIFVAVAVILRLFGAPLYDALLSLHGQPPAGH